MEVNKIRMESPFSWKEYMLFSDRQEFTFKVLKDN